MGPTRILVPLVTQTEHVKLITETLAQARRELRRDGLEFGDPVPLGFMIEVGCRPADDRVVGRSGRFLRALGTNDLVASLLGIDRDDPVGSSRNDPLHPGVLRMIQEAIEAALTPPAGPSPSAASWRPTRKGSSPSPRSGSIR